MRVFACQTYVDNLESYATDLYHNVSLLIEYLEGHTYMCYGQCTFISTMLLFIGMYYVEFIQVIFYESMEQMNILPI
jgi:hypothetical protein